MLTLKRTNPLYVYADPLGAALFLNGDFFLDLSPMVKREATGFVPGS